MRSLISATVLALTLTACGGEDETFEAKGNVLIIGADKAQVLAADGATTGDRCQGTGLLSDFGGGDEVIVLDSDGSKVAVGKLLEGKLPDGAADVQSLGLNMCELKFSVDDVPASDELMTLKIGEKEVTFKQEDADSIEVDVAGDSYP